MDNNINLDTKVTKKKGNGIFLAIVGVATLIIAIMGATFAYFSANTESEENAVNLGAYEFKLKMEVEPIYPRGTSALIPLNARNKLKNTKGEYVTYDKETKTLGTSTLETDAMTYLEYALNVAENKCVDDNGLQVCALYRVKIENQAANQVTLTGQIKTISNMPGEGEERTGFLNLTYQELSGNHEEFNMGLVRDPIKLNHEPEGTITIGNIEIPAAEVNPDNGAVTKVGVGYSYVLIYLNDNEDQSSEMGATYTGQLIYTSGAGTGNTLTGTFTVEGPEEEPETPSGDESGSGE